MRHCAGAAKQPIGKRRQLKCTAFDLENHFETHGQPQMSIVRTLTCITEAPRKAIRKNTNAKTDPGFAQSAEQRIGTNTAKVKANLGAAND